MRALLVSLLAAVAVFGQPAPKFPTATATWQDLLVAKPAARATLSAGISDVATAIPVSDGSYYVAFSAVQIQEEVILVCSVDGNTLNVCPAGRGFSGTAAAPHGIGLAVRNTITTHHHNQVAAEVKAIQEALGPNLSNVASSWDNISGKPSVFPPSAHAAAHAPGQPDSLSGYYLPLTGGTISHATQPLLTLQVGSDTGKARLFSAIPGEAGRVDLSQNAYWNGAWMRDDEAAPANLLVMSSNGGKFMAAAAGANPITFTIPLRWDSTGTVYMPTANNSVELGQTAVAGTYTRLRFLNQSRIWGFVNDTDGTFRLWDYTRNAGAISVDGIGGVSIPGTLAVNGAITGSITGNAGSVTNGVVTTGSYSDPSWLTISKAKVGLGSVENTALSTWGGSANITTVGTLGAGTVPWARLSNVPGSFTPAAHTHGTADLTNLSSWAGSTAITTLGTISAGTVPWARLSSVPGSFTPSAHSHAIGDLSTVGDWSSKITSGSYSINISGTAAAATNASAVPWSGVSAKPAWNSDPATFIGGAWTLPWKNYGTSHVIFDASAGTAPNGTAVNNTNSGTAWSASYPTLMGWNGSSTYGVRVDSARVADGVAWAGVSGRPTALSQFTNDSGFQTSGGSVNYATSAGSAPANGGNADTTDGLHVHGGANTEANKIVRTDANGYLNTGYINSNISVENGSPARFIYDNGDNYFRKTSLDVASKAVFNARTLDASWAWQDDYLALPTSVVQWGVFTPRAANAVIASVVCWADTGDAVIQLRRNDGGDMINGNLACNGSASTNLNGTYASIPVGYYVGMWAVSGSAKSIRAAITYTVAY